MEKHQNQKNKSKRKIKNPTAFLKAVVTGEVTIESNIKKKSGAVEIPENEFKAALSEFMEEKNRYFELFNSAPAGYVILDASYRIVGINTEGSRLIDAEEMELAGVSFSNFIAPEYTESFQFFLKTLKAGKKDDSCLLKIQNNPDFFIFRGATGGEEVPDKQTFLVLFFNLPNTINTTNETKSVGTEGKKMSENEQSEITAQQVTTEDILGSLSVLVADDDEVARIYLAELLKNKCREVLFAKNGKEAVEMMQNNTQVDLILMDIKMPVMDGYSATIKIKGMNKNVVIIAQTAYALASDREKALAAGCNDYLAKPLMKKDLFSVIEKFFNPNNS